MSLSLGKSICSMYCNDYVFLCGREAKHSTLRKRFHGSCLLSISEIEETGSLEPDVAEPNSGELKVHKISVHVCF